MQKASQDNTDSDPPGGPISPVFSLPPPPSYALSLYGAAWNSGQLSFSGVSGTRHNSDGSTSITYGETHWIGSAVNTTWNNEFFDLSTTAAAQHTLHESMHLIPGFTDQLLANTAAKMAGSSRSFTDTDEASRYLNEQLQSHCH